MKLNKLNDFALSLFPSILDKLSCGASIGQETFIREGLLWQNLRVYWWGGGLFIRQDCGFFERGCLLDQLWYFNLVASHVIFLVFPHQVTTHLPLECLVTFLPVVT